MSRCQAGLGEVQKPSAGRLCLVPSWYSLVRELHLLTHKAAAVVPQPRVAVLVPARGVLGRHAQHAPRAAPS